MIVDYTQEYRETHKWPDLIAAEGFGRNFILVFKLLHREYTYDGRRVSYCVKDFWLSTECENAGDDAWANVLGSEEIYFSKREVDAAMKKHKETGEPIRRCFGII